MVTTGTHKVTPFGGVSAVKRGPALKHFVQTPDDLAPAARGAGAYPKFKNHGGPVVNAPSVHASYWGAAWQSDPAHVQRAQRMNQFLADLLASQYMNILSQYGAGAGAGKAGTFVGSSNVPNVPSQLTDANIQSLLQAEIDGGRFPEPGKPSTHVVMIYLAEDVEVQGPDPARMCEPNGDNAFGYHHFFTTTGGSQFYYSVIPGLDDACLGSSCPVDANCSLHLAETQEQRQTQVSSHEYSEMVTDPEGTTWYDGKTGAENGDICNGMTGTITVGGRTWTVQLMYSKADDKASKGARTCIVGAPQPIPKVR